MCRVRSVSARACVSPSQDFAAANFGGAESGSSHLVVPYAANRARDFECRPGRGAGSVPKLV